MSDQIMKLLREIALAGKQEDFHALMYLAGKAAAILDSDKLEQAKDSEDAGYV